MENRRDYVGVNARPFVDQKRKKTFYRKQDVCKQLLDPGLRKEPSKMTTDPIR